jgi:hypothetical protein
VFRTTFPDPPLPLSCFGEEEFDLRVDAPQIVRRPLLQHGIEILVKPEQESFFDAHE